MFSKEFHAAAIVLAIASTASAVVQIGDYGFPQNGGNQNNPSCAPACRVSFIDEEGCNDVYDVAGLCSEQNSIVNFNICDFSVTLDITQPPIEDDPERNGKGGSIAYNRPNEFYAVPINKCDAPQAANPTGGQCTYTSGCSLAPQT